MLILVLILVLALMLTLVLIYCSFFFSRLLPMYCDSDLQ